MAGRIIGRLCCVVIALLLLVPPTACGEYEVDDAPRGSTGSVCCTYCYEDERPCGSSCLPRELECPAEACGCACTASGASRGCYTGG